MLASDINTQIRLFESLPHRIQSAIVAYANAAKIPPSAVIEFALSHFLELNPKKMGEVQNFERGESILTELPSLIQAAIAQYALETEVPPDFVVELAIAHFLDPDSVTFDDCQTGVQRDRIELLKLQYDAGQTRAA